MSKSLQGENVNILDARVWIDGLMEVQPAFATYIAQTLVRAVSGFLKEVEHVSPQQRSGRFVLAS